MNLDEVSLPCPYCGEGISVEIDHSAGRKQRFYEDCHVCCRAIIFEIQIDKSGRTSAHTAHSLLTFG